MSFYRKNEDGSIKRRQVGLDCQAAIAAGEKVLTEQSHKAEVNINQIVRRHGMDLISKTAALMAPAMRFDDVTGNDFQEAMEKVERAKYAFMALPSPIRDKFENNPAKFLDFVQNPDNLTQLQEWGLAQRPAPSPAPIEVIVTNPETPPE